MFMLPPHSPGTHSLWKQSFPDVALGEEGGRDMSPALPRERPAPSPQVHLASSPHWACSCHLSTNTTVPAIRTSPPRSFRASGSAGGQLPHAALFQPPPSRHTHCLHHYLSYTFKKYVLRVYQGPGTTESLFV